MKKVVEIEFKNCNANSHSIKGNKPDQLVSLFLFLISSFFEDIILLAVLME